MNPQTPDELLAEAQAMLDRAAIDPDGFDQDAYDGLLNRAERAAKVDKIRAAVNSGRVGTETAFSSPNVIVRTNALDGLDLQRESAGDLRDRGLRLAEDNSLTRGLTDAQRETLSDRVDRVPGAAAHVLAHGTPAYR